MLIAGFVAAGFVTAGCTPKPPVTPAADASGAPGTTAGAPDTIAGAPAPTAAQEAAKQKAISEGPAIEAALKAQQGR